MIIAVTKPHDLEQLVEELLEAVPPLRGSLRPDGYYDAPDGFVIASSGTETKIEVPSDELGVMVEAVVATHKPKGSKAEAARKKAQERLESLRLSKNKPPSAKEWGDLLDHLRIH